MWPEPGEGACARGQSRAGQEQRGPAWKSRRGAWVPGPLRGIERRCVLLSMQGSHDDRGLAAARPQAYGRRRGRK